MKSVTSSKLQNNLDQLLDEILNTGKPLEIERNGKRLIISPVETVDKLQKLIYRPQAIIGDPDDLVQISWKRQTLIYLDTHIVVWLYAGLTAKLSDCAKHLINENELYISPIVRLGLQYLYEIGRITEKSDDIVLELVSCLDLKVCKKDFNLIINQSVIINWTRDPFDCLIVSNASVDNHILLTKDYHILNHYENAVWD